MQVAEYGYNELGQLVTKKLHKKPDNSFVENVDIRYNIRGWMKTQSAPKFSMVLNYEDAATPQYNGNIGAMLWTNSGESQRSYAFSYDKLNRLTGAVMPTSGFDEKNIGYDLNGNMLNLTRTENGNTVDQLAMLYTGNRRFNVRDNAAAPNSGTNDFRDNGNVSTSVAEYTYDANGNQLTDLNKGIVGTTYNYLNMPTQFNLGGGKLVKYIYAANGTKLRRIALNGAVKDSTDYVGGIQYENYVLDFFGHAEGFVKAVSATTYDYRYVLQDHLGNSRVVFSQDGTVLQKNNYYAFGKAIDAWDYSGPGAAYQYQYNGKEKQHVLGLRYYDYGARLYDADVPTWLQIDPKADSMRRWSPYNYVYGNPLRWVDPDGMQPETLKVNGSSDFRQKQLTDLQSLTTDRLHMDDDGYVTIIQNNAMNCNDNLAEGTKLVADVINNSNIAVIDDNTGYLNASGSADNEKSDKGIPTDAKIKIDPQKTTGGLNERGDKNRPANIGLAHELVHAVNVMTGKSAISDNKILPNVIDPDTGAKGRVTKEEIGVRNRENLIRKEQKQPLRIIPK